MADALPVDALVPHRGPARLIESVVRWRPGAITCRGRIPQASPLAQGERAPCYLGLELMAQGAAALEALVRAAEAVPRVGYLVGVSEARFLQPDLPVGTLLTAVVEQTGRAGPLGVYRGSVERDGVECLSATFSTYSKP
jgi:predicted hotdog family 3-hydroxylacyl-ACP dehydratase